MTEIQSKTRTVLLVVVLGLAVVAVGFMGTALAIESDSDVDLSDPSPGAENVKYVFDLRVVSGVHPEEGLGVVTIIADEEDYTNVVGDDVTIELHNDGDPNTGADIIVEDLTVQEPEEGIIEILDGETHTIFESDEVSEGAVFRVNINGVTNPSEGGTYQTGVETNQGTYTEASYSIYDDPAHMFVASEPAEEQTAGVEIEDVGGGESPGVIVEDSSGNPVPDVSVTVVATGGDGELTDDSTTEVETDSSGVAAFDDLVIETADEGYQLQFETAELETTSQSFDVSHADATQLAFDQQPTDTTAGGVIDPSVTVEILDEFGNRAEGDSALVSLDTVGGSGDLGGSTDVETSGGVATFDDLVIEEADDYVLRASATNLDSDDSEQFTISAAGATDIEVDVQPQNTVAGEPIEGPPRVLVTDSMGNPVDNVAVEVTVSEGSGTIEEGEMSVSTDENGLAEFDDLVIEEADEGYQLQFTMHGSDPDVDMGNSTQSDSFDVEATAANSVSVSRQPTAEKTAGEPIAAGTEPPQATVTDRFGNPVANVEVTVSEVGGYEFDDGTLTQSTSPTGAVDFGDLVIETADEGYRLEFSINEADDNVDESDTAQSSTFDVVPADEDQLVFGQQPTDTVAGETIEPPVTVEILDEFGNLVDDADDSVTLSVIGGSSLDGTTEQNAVDGVATFDDLSIDEADDYSLRAESGDLSDADSDQFTITAGDANSVDIEIQPQDTTAGESIEGPPTVEVTDSFGNPVEGVDVSVEVSQGEGTIESGDMTVETDQDGLAEFGDLVIETADEDYVLEFSIDESDGNVEASDAVQSDTFTVESAPVHEVTATVDGDESPTVPVGTLRTITVAIEDEFENSIEGETISVDAIDDGADNVTVDGLSVGNSTSVTDENGEATFTGVSFVGEVNATVDVTVSAEDGTDDTMAVTLETGPVTGLTAAIDGEIAPTVPVDAERNVTVTATDAGGNPVEGEPISVDVIDDGGDDVTVAGLQEGDVQGTDENGTATFPDVAVSGEVGATVNVTVSYGEGPPGEGGIYDTMTVTLDTGNVTSLAATIDGSASPTVTAGETNYITVTATDAAGNPVEDETIAVNAIRTFGDDVTISGLSRGNQESTNQNGQAFFGTLTFDGEHGGTVDVSLVADNGVSTTLTATVDNPFTGFAVDITDTNSPVIEGEPLEVTATIENPGVENGTQPVEIAVGSVTHNETYTIPAGETVTETLVWDTTAGDAGEYLATVETPGHSANATVTVLPPRPQFLEGVIRDSNPDTVELTLDRPVRLNDATSETAGFAVHVDGQSVELTGATADGDKVFVDMASPVVAGQTVVVSYDGDSDNVESHDGMEAAPFEEVSIDNRIVAANLSIFDPAVDLVTDTVSVGVEVDFRAIDSHVPADADATYHWVIGDREFTTDEPQLSLAFDEPGEVTAQVTVVADGQEDTATVVMMVIDDEPPDVHLTGSDTIEVGEDPGFDASESTDNVAIANYSWDFGDGTTDEGADLTRPPHVYDDPGEYDVTVTVTDTSGNVGTASLTVIVEDADESTIASVLSWLLLALVIIGLLLASYYYYRRRQTSLQ